MSGVICFKESNHDKLRNELGNINKDFVTWSVPPLRLDQTYIFFRNCQGCLCRDRSITLL